MKGVQDDAFGIQYNYNHEEKDQESVEKLFNQKHDPEIRGERSKFTCKLNGEFTELTSSGTPN